MISHTVSPIKILLFQPFTHGRTTAPPLGLACLESYLSNKTSLNCEIRVVDNDEKQFSQEDLENYVRKFNPMVIGVTANILNQFNAVRNARIFKDYPYVIFGGPQPSLDAESFLKEKNFLVIKGEGEVTFSNIIKAIVEGRDVHHVHGVTYRDPRGEIIDSHREKLIRNLDDLPVPDLKVFNYAKYRTHIEGERSTVMLSSRGCPFKCMYCYHQLNAKFRQRSPGSIIDEMLHYRQKYGIKAIKFFDDNFTLIRKFVVDFCQHLIERKVHMTWTCLSAVKNVDQELLYLMHKAGCRTISFGIESACQKTLKLIGKKTTIEQNRSAIEMCRKAGIKSKAYIMIGFPWETQDDILQTGRFLRETPPDFAQILIATPMPNTGLERAVKERGYDIDIHLLDGIRDFNIPTFETENFSKDELVDLHRRVTRMYETSPRLKMVKMKRKIKKRLTRNK